MPLALSISICWWWSNRAAYCWFCLFIVEVIVQLCQKLDLLEAHESIVAGSTQHGQSSKCSHASFKFCIKFNGFACQHRMTISKTIKPFCQPGILFEWIIPVLILVVSTVDSAVIWAQPCCAEVCSTRGWLDPLANLGLFAAMLTMHLNCCLLYYKAQQQGFDCLACNLMSFLVWSWM